MPFEFYDVECYEAQENELFLFDANVWIFWLNPWKLKPREKKYNQFLNYLLGLKEEPRVLLPAAVLSEVVNLILKGRNFDSKYFRRYLSDPKNAKAVAAMAGAKDYELYKKLYRPSQQYYNDRNKIYTSIFSFSSTPLITVCDDFDKIGLDDLTTSFSDLDFTDWIILNQAKKHGAIIVSDDGDFVIENHPIVTGRSELLAL